MLFRHLSVGLALDIRLCLFVISVIILVDDLLSPCVVTVDVLGSHFGFPLYSHVPFLFLLSHAGFNPSERHFMRFNLNPSRTSWKSTSRDIPGDDFFAGIETTKYVQRDARIFFS